VTTGAQTSDAESEPGLGFTMLKADEAQIVHDGESRIRNLALSDAATRLLLANLYAGQGLNAEAIALLENSTQSAREPVIVRFLGDLYLKVSLNRQAEDSFLQALDLSQKVSDIEGQAAAQNALGLVYEMFGNKAEAIQRSQKAAEWYQKLGDSKTAKEIQSRLAALQKQ
jgi:tetratricopeptide (TPR) repeat protein